MPSIAESRREVRERLDGEVDHDALLAGLQDEIDKHNALTDDLRGSMRTSGERSTRFRFKDDSRDKSNHHHRSNRDDGSDERHKRKRRKRADRESSLEEDQPHPFPREPADPVESAFQSDAFRASLFDALADDEGAAAYWENVYNQPIHVYPRPKVENETTGQLEEMNDEEYVEYVKQQMWERKHPEVVHERKKRERDRKEEEELRTRRREDFVRRKEQAAWERSERRRFRDSSGNGRYGYEFAGDDASSTKAERQEYAAAWPTYLSAWDKLKREILEQRQESNTNPPIEPSKRIPWPVLKSKPPTKPNIEAFMQNIPADNREEKLRLLKAERVRWHPDKVQQRFGSTVDEGTMKVVTGVFQVMDALVEQERRRVDG